MSATVTGGPPQIIEVLIPGGPPGPPGPQGPPGASSLTDLTDVTGQTGAGKSPVNDGTTDSPWTRVTTQEDLDAILTSVAAVNWRPLTLRPGFTPYGQGFADPRYRLTLNNVVHAEGMVACSPPLSDNDVGKVVSTFDTDALPGDTLLFGCPAFGNNARFDVQPNGDLTFQGMLIGGGQIDWFSLTPITFSVGSSSSSSIVAAALAATFG